MKKLIKFAEIILFLMFAVLLIFLRQKLTILYVIPVIVLIFFYQKKVNIKHYSLFLFIIALLIRLLSITILKVEITDDFKTMLDASKMLIQGNLSFMNGFYFQTYPFQLGLVLYQAILLKIFNSTFFLKIMNSIITSLIVVMIYKISKKLVKESTARIISFAYLFYLYPIYLNSILTNQHIQALLLLIVINWIINKKDTIKKWIGISLLLGIANFFRTESIIIILGILVYQIITLTKKNWKEKTLHTGICLLTYLLFTTITTQVLLLSPLYKEQENNLDKNVTLWKFYCGLSDEANGLYNEKDVNAYFNTKEEKELLLTRIKNDYKKFPILFLKKEVILWTQTNYDLRITNKWNNNLYQILLDYNQGYLNVVMILLVISLFPKKTEEDKKILWIKILLALYYGVYLFIEISPRYAYNLHMLVFLILGISLERILNKENYVNATKIIQKTTKKWWFATSRK